MAAIVTRLYAENPKNLTDDFSHVKFYDATDSSGSGKALLATVAIDTSNTNPIDSGFTSYLHNTGDNTKYVSASYYYNDGATSRETRTSEWVLQGQDRWDTMFKNEMQDSAEAVWDATDRQYFKERALEALFPDFFFEKIDTSLTVDNNSSSQTYQYTLPQGFFYIAEVGIGRPNSQSVQKFVIVTPDNWKVEQNKLMFASLSGLTDDYDIRLVGSKKYMEVGEVPVRLDSLIMIHLRMSAYMQMSDDFPRFLKWSRMQKGTKVSFAEMKEWVKSLDRMFQAEKQRIKSSVMSTSN